MKRLGFLFSIPALLAFHSCAPVAYADGEAVASDESLPVNEIEIATIKIQRVDDIEFAYGEANDVGELTYGLDSADGNASLHVGTVDGTKVVRDPDAFHVIKPRLLDRAEYVIAQAGNMTNPILVMPGEWYSFFGTVSGSTTNHWRTGVKGVNDTPRTLRISSLSENVYITGIEYEYLTYEYQAQVGSGTKEYNEGVTVTYVMSGATNLMARAHGRRAGAEAEKKSVLDIQNQWSNCATDYDLIAESKVDKTGGGSDVPGTERAGFVIGNIKVYGVDRRALEAPGANIIDTSIFKVYVKEADGSFYDIGSFRSYARKIHEVQDRWSYYPAAQKVDMNSQKVWLDSDETLYIKGNEDLTAEIGSDVGKYITFDRGNTNDFAIIRGIKCVKNDSDQDVVRIYCMRAFGTSLGVKYAHNLGDPWVTRNDVVNLGEQSYDGRTLICLEVPVIDDDRGFYKVTATVTEERGFGMTIHPDVIRFGSDEVELRLIEINLGNQTYKVLGAVVQ